MNSSSIDRLLMQPAFHGLLGIVGVMIFSISFGQVVPSSKLAHQRESNDAEKIQAVLEKQASHWNDHDIDGFMDTYWKSENMTFSGGGKTRRGWQATLDRYKKSYPGDKMGKLHFDGLEIELLSEDAAFVLGFWHLDIKGEKKDGNFTLVLKKLDNHWKIVHDHSSTDESEEEKCRTT